MDSIYIKATDLNYWITKYFTNKDLISIDDLIGCIEDLDGKVKDIEEELNNVIEDRDTNWVRKPVSSQVRDE